MTQPTFPVFSIKYLTWTTHLTILKPQYHGGYLMWPLPSLKQIRVKILPWYQWSFSIDYITQAAFIIIPLPYEPLSPPRSDAIMGGRAKINIVHWCALVFIWITWSGNQTCWNPSLASIYYRRNTSGTYTSLNVWKFSLCFKTIIWST